MKFLFLLLTFTLAAPSVLQAQGNNEVSVLGDQSVLIGGRRVPVSNRNEFSGFSIIPPRGNQRLNFTGAVGDLFEPFVARHSGITITQDIVSVCNDIENAVTQASRPDQIVDMIVSQRRFGLRGISRQKFMDAYRYYLKDLNEFGSGSSDSYARNNKRDFCQTSLARALANSVNAIIKPGVSGVDPEAERRRLEAARAMTDEQINRCEYNAGSFTNDCPPITLNPLNRTATNDMFNIANIVNSPHSITATTTASQRPSTFNLFTNTDYTDPIGRRLLNSTRLEELLPPELRLCNCNEANYRLGTVPTDKINDERKKIASLVRDRLYKKFLNDYAQNREDISFFMNHRGNILNGQNPDLLSCKKVSGFQARANKKCEDNGVKPEDRKKREAELFGKIRVKDSNADIKTNWKELDNKISTIDFPQGTTGLPENISSKGLSRISFDEVRHGFSEDSRSRAFNRMLTNLTKDSKFRQWYKDNPPGTPSVMLMDYMFFVKNDPQRVEEIAKMAEDDDAIDINTFKEKIDDNFVKLMQDVTAYSPEFRITLSNPAIFKDVMDRAASPDFKDFKQVITNDPKANGANQSSLIYEKHLSHKCGMLMETFANAVCVDDQKIIDDARPDELRKLIQENPTAEIDSQYATHLTCKSNTGLNSIALDIDAPYSSLLSRVVEKEKDFFENIKDQVLEKDPTVLSYISGMAREASGSSVEIDNKAALEDNNTSFGAPSGRSYGSSGAKSSLWDHVASDGSIKSERVYSQNKLIAPAGTDASSKQKATSSEIVNSKTDTEKISLDQGIEQQNGKDTKVATADVPFSGTYSSRPGTEKVSESKTELRQNLGADGNKPEVQQQVSRIDEGMAEELNRLREEAAQNRQKLADLTSQAQESKIRMLQDQLKRLQDERKTIVETSPVVPVVAPESARNDYVIGNQRNSNVNREPGSEGSIENENNNLAPGQKPNTISQDASNVSNVGPNSSRNLSRTDASAQTDGPNGGSTAPLVVTATAVRSESAVDMNLEIIKFLDAANPDLSTLTQIKDQGLLYRYKVVVNGVEREQEVLIRFSGLNENARVALERKISQRRSENPRLAQIEDSIAEIQRTVSYESLKYIIGQQLSR